MAHQWSSLVVFGPDRNDLPGRDLSRHGGLRHVSWLRGATEWPKIARCQGYRRRQGGWLVPQTMNTRCRGCSYFVDELHTPDGGCHRGRPTYSLSNARTNDRSWPPPERRDEWPKQIPAS